MLGPVKASSMQHSTTVTGDQLYHNCSQGITPVQRVDGGHHAGVGTVLHVEHL